MSADVVSVAVWISTAGVGFVVGLVGLAVTRRRTRHPAATAAQRVRVAPEASVGAS